jgi:hypothetical protein
MAHDFEPEVGGFSDPSVQEGARGDVAVRGAASTYLVTAYRWGQTNNHWYHVYCGPDRTKALALAQNECDDRGGKYGAVVWEFDEDGVDYKRIAYFTSSQDTDDGPYHSHQRDYLERLGFTLDEAYSGKCLLAKPDETRMEYVMIELPPALRGEVERQRRNRDAMQKAFDDVKAKKSES